MTLECQDRNKDGHVCRGEIMTGPSASGASEYTKCEVGWNEYGEFSRSLHEDINSRYPGYDNPHSLPPAWFDESYAGERWDSDY